MASFGKLIQARVERYPSCIATTGSWYFSSAARTRSSSGDIAEPEGLVPGIACADIVTTVSMAKVTASKFLRTVFIVAFRAILISSTGDRVTRIHHAFRFGLVEIELQMS